MPWGCLIPIVKVREDIFGRTGGSTSLSLHHYYLNKNMKLSYLFMILLLGSIRKAERAGDAAG